MSSNQIISNARKCIGTPFHHQGRLPGVGLDCAGLVVVSMEQAGYPIFSDMEGYSKLPHPTQMRDALAGSGQQMTFSQAQPADVIWYRIAEEPCHLAIYTGNTIIHAYWHAGEVIEQTLSKKWTEPRAIMGVYRHRGLLNE